MKGEATEAIRKAKLLKIEPIHKQAKRIDTTHVEDQDDDEFGDELFEEINVDKINAEERDNTHTMNSSKLPPLQRLFPLSYDPAMMEDATYKGPPSSSLMQDATTNPKDKGKEKANPDKEGKFDEGAPSMHDSFASYRLV